MATNQIEVLKTKALENRQKARPIETLIQNSLKELGKAVPSHLSAERLVRIALTTIRLNPKLTECTPESFLGALYWHCRDLPRQLVLLVPFPAALPSNRDPRKSNS